MFCMKYYLSKLFSILITAANALNTYDSKLLNRQADHNDSVIMQREIQIKTVINSKQPVLLLPVADDTLSVLQRFVLSDTGFTKYFVDEKTKRNTLSEIFGIYRLLSSNNNEQVSAACTDGSCYRIEMYNYAYNLTSVAVVNFNSKTVVNVNHYFDAQPLLPLHLRNLATYIAVNSPDVQNALGIKPEEQNALMAATQTALNYTRCERSKHLCVAPTFIKDQKALWCVVDLTELSLTGLRWTNLGRDSIPVEMITERKLQNEYITNCFCLQENKIDSAGWTMKYSLTSSDGLRISDVSFKGTPVLSSAKLVDWHVSYSNTDGFGYSDAIGCPEFSQSAVLAIEPPTISDLIIDNKKAGIVLEQKFYSEGWPHPCNYNYVQRYEFFDDGRFRISCGSLGRGCGNDGTYRPVFRIAFAGENNSFFENKNNVWQQWKKEQWKKFDFAKSPENNQGYTISGTDVASYNMTVSTGQFADGGRGDNPYIYVTKNHIDKDEGESDLVTIGPCCNTDYHQGPEKFIEPLPEAIDRAALVLWYVPELKNDDTPGKEYCWAKAQLINGVYKVTSYPCMAGPMFTPVHASDKTK